MDEQTIVENLKANLPQPQESTPPAPEQPNTDQDHSSVGMKLDDITQYKLHDFFGAKYKPSDEISNQQVSYIYEHVAEMLENPEYSYVVAKIRDLERILGTSNSSQRVFKLYQWLKLDNMRKNIEREQGALTNEW
jgi:hypothetical protein